MPESNEPRYYELNGTEKILPFDNDMLNGPAARKINMVYELLLLLCPNKNVIGIMVTDKEEATDEP